jgi:zinc/manganese transport system substrate-binding protein
MTQANTEVRAMQAITKMGSGKMPGIVAKMLANTVGGFCARCAQSLGASLRSNLAATIALIAAVVVLGSVPDARAAGGKINLVAAENFYGDIARQIGGDNVIVTSILSNPDQDPHLFETTPSVARSLAAAQVVIFNGADYDPWMEKMLKSSPQPGRIAINAAQLVGKKAGDNPHLWYDPATMPAVAKTLAAALTAADPAHGMAYAERLKTFITSLTPVNKKIAEIRGKFSGAPVTASEPVFGYMASALNLTMRNERFQLSVMNDTEPSARDVAAFEQDLKTHKVRVMFYNKQANDKAVQHLVAIARASNVPVVGVTETAPAGVSYQQWMLNQLNDTEKALAGPNS